ncbi:hypothetical protein [Parvicella tangerina]|uniref:Uncharacterized protein n=1 Tax=Parvicella tangerina TaxID=2829795 RepID=A0A916NHM8_9FLAO|nr:hypothetical protein [Parvicella tangerina]CAG5081861.1 hypothetical protein CRYO30217_01747 [Parvicella tangerina]
MLIIGMVVANLSLSAQHVIKVKKGQTITGSFCWQDDDRTKDYLYFTEDGWVYLLENTKKNSKKALKTLKSCASEPSCNDVRSMPYTFEKNIVNFAIEHTDYVKDYNGQFEAQGAKMVFKVSETDQLMIVKEFERVE